MKDIDYKKTIRAFAPATIANLSCGFDILGLAIENLGDEVSVKFQKEKKVSISKIIGGGGKLPLNSALNTCTVGIIEMLKKISFKYGVVVELKKKLPLGSGMGSSAASAVAGILATNALLGYPFKKEELLSFAMESERIACGSAHADNVAPCLFGGISLIKSYEPLDVVQIKTDLPLYCSLVHPDIQVNTKDARNILPKKIYLKDAIKQWGNVAGLISALITNDAELLKRSLKDFVVEPVRSKLIPHFYEIQKVALENSALGCGISGSGPTMFALSLNKHSADNISKKMSYVFSKNKISNQFYVSKINLEGAKII